jgi:hypothetical protein
MSLIEFNFFLKKVIFLFNYTIIKIYIYIGKTMKKATKKNIYF